MDCDNDGPSLLLMIGRRGSMGRRSSSTKRYTRRPAARLRGQRVTVRGFDAPMRRGDPLTARFRRRACFEDYDQPHRVSAHLEAAPSPPILAFQSMSGPRNASILALRMALPRRTFGIAVH